MERRGSGGSLALEASKECMLEAFTVVRAEVDRCTEPSLWADAQAVSMQSVAGQSREACGEESGQSLESPCPVAAERHGGMSDSCERTRRWDRNSVSQRLDVW
eukprot:CAMPEP_0174732706 /NCGR_PEP_ID=MMETSP1094-20130205/59896_1 /TAXON_ID=156173 /ORGANISM="Chrysochromulina brevifilum, Strain UTEX LB 985" /LENGTH=102 /DNA_ID=CAMNT_0015935255 /DNA_START=119 /DNA_END=424 /DNA_ORIENTATION=-